MNAVRLLRLGKAQQNIVEELRTKLSAELKVPITIQEDTLNILSFYDFDRSQYNSTEIIKQLLQMYSKSSDKVLAVIDDDLYIPVLTFVFGEAQLDGLAAVVSYHRLQNEQYGLPPNPELLSERLLKESLHELGHTYGLIHCGNQICAMHISTSVEEVDMKGSTFCNNCKEFIGL